VSLRDRADKPIDKSNREECHCFARFLAARDSRDTSRDTWLRRGDQASATTKQLVSRDKRPPERSANFPLAFSLARQVHARRHARGNARRRAAMRSAGARRCRRRVTARSAPANFSWRPHVDARWCERLFPLPRESSESRGVAQRSACA